MVYLIVFSPRGNYIIRAKDRKLENSEGYGVVGRYRAESIRKHSEVKNYPKESIRAIFEND